MDRNISWSLDTPDKPGYDKGEMSPVVIIRPVRVIHNPHDLSVCKYVLINTERKSNDDNGSFNLYR